MRLCFLFKKSKSNRSDTGKGALDYVSITKKINIIVRRYTKLRYGNIISTVRFHGITVYTKHYTAVLTYEGHLNGRKYNV
jgi:hypothetical protein